MSTRDRHCKTGGPAGIRRRFWQLTPTGPWCRHQRLLLHQLPHSGDKMQTSLRLKSTIVSRFNVWRKWGDVAYGCRNGVVRRRPLLRCRGRRRHHRASCLPVLGYIIRRLRDICPITSRASRQPVPNPRSFQLHRICRTGSDQNRAILFREPRYGGA